MGEYLCDRGAGDAIIDDVLTEIYDFRTGRLFDPYGVEIPVDTKAGAKFFDLVFGGRPEAFYQPAA